MVYAENCILFLITYARVYSSDMACNSTNTCSACVSEKGCTYWACIVDDKFTNITDCELTTAELPTQQCEYGGKWSKIEIDDNCPRITLTTTNLQIVKYSVDTTTTTAYDFISSTEKSPEYISNNITTTTTNTTNTPTFAIIHITGHQKTISKGTLTLKTTENGVPFWPIFSLLISSLIGVAVISFITTRRMPKKYFDQNYYQPQLENVNQSNFSDVTV